MNIEALALFIPTCFVVSITPGMCMTLALTLGMSVGVRRTFWMMGGELLGVALVGITSALGIATLMLNYPKLFVFFKMIGGVYLIYLGIGMWRTRYEFKPQQGLTHSYSSQQLFLQGFITAVANPKGWAFMVALLPPFLQSAPSFTLQLIALLSIMVISELICMTLYATGGQSLQRFLHSDHQIKIMNSLAGTLMIAIGIWLALS